MKRIDSEKRQALIKEYKRSGLTQTEYCQRRGMAVQTFKGWLKAARKAGFVEIDAGVAPSSMTKLEVVFADGTVVKIGGAA
jgi:transposase-like protein